MPLERVTAYPSFNAIDLLDSYEIQTIVNPTSLTVTHTSNANSTGSGGGDLLALLQQPAAIFTFSGAKSEATLRSEGRILGPLGAQQDAIGSFSL